MSGWDEQDRWLWGRAGVRLDSAEAERRRRAHAEERGRARLVRERDDARAEALYRGGHLSPWRITVALDAKGLDGPEVDAACGAAEPDVDLWEAGVLYPTWEQVQRLAALCGVTPRFLMDDAPDRARQMYVSSTLRFHHPMEGTVIVEKFAPEAVRDRLRPLTREAP